MIVELLRRLGIEEQPSGVCLKGEWVESPGGPDFEAINPATAETIATVRGGSVDDYGRSVDAAASAFKRWRTTPAPVRGEVVRRIGVALRESKEDLGLLVTLEAGKIRSEGLGEVQEMIDMADFAVGLSRQLYGLTIASERPEHRMMEQWHPLGPVGVITAFNFPVAVWAWNALVAAVCGDTIVWKPAPETTLTAIAVQKIVQRAIQGMGAEGVFNLCVGGAEDVGEAMIADDRLPLISATGSCRMGRRVAEVVGGRLGRSLLELGGNNAAIVTASADVEQAARACVFAAVGTAGQRCTTLRRLIVHESIASAFLDRLGNFYRSIRIGDPSEENVLMGPLIRERARGAMAEALKAAASQGGTKLLGGVPVDRPGFFVEPAIVLARPGMPIVGVETFAPILYTLRYRDLDEAIALQNSVEQGLSSCIFTTDLREAERFLSAKGSDCGIANVNIGTSGAEIGGAFGGEKATGGGREAGSDSWKAYMRRQTCTIHYGRGLPLAQGVEFDPEQSSS